MKLLHCWHNIVIINLRNVPQKESSKIVHDGAPLLRSVELRSVNYNPIGEYKLMKYYVYILKSKKDNSLYVGLTTNIDKRFELHNNAKSNYTKGHLPYELKFNCEFPNKYIAAKFEKYLKSASGRAFTNKRLLE